MITRWIWAFLLPCGLLTSCGNLGDFERVKEDFHYSYPLEPGGHLDFDNRNGTVEIAGWDRNSVDVSGTKFAPSRAELQQVRISVNVSGNDVHIRTEWPDRFGGSFGAKYLIRVPRKIALTRAQTTNGGVSAEDLEGGGSLTSTNGRIFLARDTGDYEIRTTNGGIELEECSGSIRAVTTNGLLRGQLKSGVIDGRSTNGTVDVTLLNPDSGRPVRLETTNGSVTLAMAAFHNNPVDVRTKHGSATLRLPADVSANLSAETSLGNISNDLTLSGSVSQSKHHLSGQLGGGGAQITVETSTGSVHIARD